MTDLVPDRARARRRPAARLRAGRELGGEAVASVSLPRPQAASSASRSSFSRRASTGASASRPARRRTSRCCAAGAGRTRAADDDRLRPRPEDDVRGERRSARVVAVACDRLQVELRAVEPGQRADPVALGRRPERLDVSPRNAAVADPDVAPRSPGPTSGRVSPNGLRSGPGSTRGRRDRAARRPRACARRAGSRAPAARARAVDEERCDEGGKLVTPIRSQAARRRSRGPPRRRGPSRPADARSRGSRCPRLGSRSGSSRRTAARPRRRTPRPTPVVDGDERQRDRLADRRDRLRRVPSPSAGLVAARAAAARRESASECGGQRRRAAASALAGERPVDLADAGAVGVHDEERPPRLDREPAEREPPAVGRPGRARTRPGVRVSRRSPLPSAFMT